MEVLIDGDNLAGWLAQEEYIAHRRDDEGLMRLLLRWQRQALARNQDSWITLVLDPGPGRDHSSHRDQVWTTVVEGGGSADGRLLAMIEEDLVQGRSLREALVVTSDRELSDQLKALGVRVMGVPAFGRRLVKGLPPRSEKPQPGDAGFADIEEQMLALAARPRAPRRTDDQDALLHALAQLAGEAIEERIAAARRLGELPDRRAVMALLETLEDPSPRLRAEAAKSLGRLGYRSMARAALLSRLQDPDPDVRQAAALALGQLHDSWAIPALRHLATTERTAQVRRAAWIALRQIDEAQSPTT
jgi:hypothetical protein